MLADNEHENLDHNSSCGPGVNLSIKWHNNHPSRLSAAASSTVGSMAQPLHLPPGYPLFPPPGYPLLPPLPPHPDLATQQGYAAIPYLPMPQHNYGQWLPYQGWPYALYAPAPLPKEMMRSHSAAPADQNTLTPARARSARVMPTSAPPTPRRYVNGQHKPEGE